MHYIITALGCKVNQYEAQAIETLLQPHGFTAAGEGDPVDLIVVNTSAVTAEGGRKSRQMIRKLREEYPQALTLASSLEPTAFNVGIAFGTAVGGAVISGPGMPYVGLVGAAFSLVAWALAALTVRLATRRR